MKILLIIALLCAGTAQAQQYYDVDTGVSSYQYGNTIYTPAQQAIGVQGYHYEPEHSVQVFQPIQTQLQPIPRSGFSQSSGTGNYLPMIP